jgi:glycine cleavage system pyridoxal-binding protein P
MRYLPNSDSDRIAMLKATGRSSVEELFDRIPSELRLRGQLNLPGPLSEPEIPEFFRQAARMIEPTESVSKEEMDSFIDALRSIAQEVEENPEFVLKAPYTTRVTRLDEAAAARKPVLRWKPPA